MKWEMGIPTYGDIIRTKVNVLYHFGVYCSDKEVIQFGKNPKDKEHFLSHEIEVIATDIKEFSNGEDVEILSFNEDDLKLIRNKTQVATIAKSRLKEKGYNFFYNNCEHFVLQCLYVNPEFAKKTHNCDRFVPNFPIKIYISNYPFIVDDISIYPNERQIEIDNCSNQKTKDEKYYVWKLLEYALKDGFNLNIEDLKFKKEANGKWVSDKISFSLSHSGELVAVAISQIPYGIDIQKIDDKDCLPIMERILNDYEKKCLPYVQENGFYRTFAIKEACFKASNDSGFVPKLYNSLVNSYTKVIRYKDAGYMLALVGNNVDKVEMHLVNELKETDL